MSNIKGTPVVIPLFEIAENPVIFESKLTNEIRLMYLGVRAKEIFYDFYNNIEYAYIIIDDIKYICLSKTIEEFKKERFHCDTGHILFNDWLVKINNLETFI